MEPLEQEIVPDAPSAESPVGTLLRSASGVFGLRIAATGISFINALLLARLLGPAQFGVYSIAVAIANVTATIAVLGLPTLVTKEVAAGVEQARWSQLRALWHLTHRWIFLSTVAVAAMATVVLFAAPARTHLSWPIVVVVFALIAAGAFNQLRAAILRGVHWVVLADAPDLAARPLVMLGFLVGALLIVTRLDAKDALYMQMIATGIAFALGTWALLAKRPRELQTAPVEPLPSHWIRRVVPFWLVAVVMLFESQVSLYLLGFLAGSREAGLFQAALQIVGLMALGLIAINLPLQSRLAAAWARRDMIQVQELVKETARMATAMALVAGVLLLLLSRFVLSIFGAEYVAAAPALQILVLGQMVNAAAGSCGVLLLMTGKEKVVVLGSLFALLINIAIGYFLIPRLGINGGAVAATAAMIVWNLVYVAYGIKRLGVNTSIFSLWTA